MENSQKPEDLSLEELIREISSKGVNNLTTNMQFNLLFKIATEYIDYYESDLGEFLFPKLYKKYYLYLFLRVLTLALYITALSLFALLEASLFSAISGIIAFLSFYAYFLIDKKISRRYKYTNSFFYKSGKKLILFKRKLDLIIHNSYLSENYTALEVDLEWITSISNNLKKRIERDTEIIRTYSYYIKEYALPSILFAPLVPFFITLIYEIVQNPISINSDAIIDLILGLPILGFLLFQSVRALVNVRKSRRFKEASIYFFYDYMTVMILELIRLSIRIQQFPKEEELKKGLIVVMNNLAKKFRNNIYPPTENIQKEIVGE